APVDGGPVQRLFGAIEGPAGGFVVVPGGLYGGVHALTSSGGLLLHPQGEQFAAGGAADQVVQVLAGAAQRLRLVDPMAAGGARAIVRAAAPAAAAGTFFDGDGHSRRLRRVIRRHACLSW